MAFADGPLHVNVAFRKPLEPSRTARRPPTSSVAPLHKPRPQAANEILEKLAEDCARSDRGLIVCGPNTEPALGEALPLLAAAFNVPLLAESTSSARLCGLAHAHRIDGFAHILATPNACQALEPEWILQFGGAPACGPLLRFLASSQGRRVRFGMSERLRDSEGVTELIVGEASTSAKRLAALARPHDPNFLQSWRRADTAAWAAVESELASSAEELGEASAMHAILTSLEAGTQLTIGNSLPIRSTDAVVAGSEARLDVLHQRGTSGIEGLIAGAFGSCASTIKSALVLGDVSFAHDIASLALHAKAHGPLAILVIDNGGGKIFSHLPVARLELSAEQWAFWETPPSIDFKLATKAHGLPYRECSSALEIREAVQWAQQQASPSVVRVTVANNSMHQFLERVRAKLS